jgi:hypothetical protein
VAVAGVVRFREVVVALVVCVLVLGLVLLLVRYMK